MVSPDECLWGKDFFDTYIGHASDMSYKNEHIHTAAALALIGQAIRNVRLRVDKSWIDGRIHPFIIQSSGTGKNAAFNFMKQVSEAAGYSFDTHGKDSTAGIMGTVKRNGEEMRGDLAGNGFVAWKEAQQLLKAAKNEYSSDITEVLNQALDPSGNVSRALSGGPLEYNSRTSVFATTYPPEPDGQIDLISQGFFPRTLFLYNTVESDFYDDVNRERSNNLPRVDEDFSYELDKMERDVEKLANTLRYVNNQVWKHGDIKSAEDTHYAQGEHHIIYFKVDDGVNINPSPIVEEMLDDYSYRVRELTKEFRTRLFDIMYKIAAALAAVDKDEERDVYVSRVIKQRHVDFAEKMIRESLESIFDFVNDYMVDVGDNRLIQVERAIRRVTRNDSGYATLKEIMFESKRRPRDVKEDIAALEEMDIVESVDSPATALSPDDRIKLNPDNQIYRDND